MASMTTDQFLASFANMAPHQRSLPSLGSLEASLKTLLTFKALQDPTSFSTLLDNLVDIMKVEYATPTPQDEPLLGVIGQKLQNFINPISLRLANATEDQKRVFSNLLLAASTQRLDCLRVPFVGNVPVAPIQAISQMAGAINNPAASPPPTKKLKTAEDSSIERISAFAVDTQHQIQGLRQMLLDLEAVMKRQITLLSERAGLALEKQADVVNSFVSEAEKIKKQVDSQNAVLQQLDRASTASRAVLDGAVRDTMTKLNASPAEVSSLFPSNAMDVDVAPFEGLQRAAGAHFSSSSSDQRSYEGSAVASGGPLFVTAPPSVDAVSNAGFAPAQWSFVPVPSAAVKSSLDLVLPSATSPTIVDSASPSQSSGNKSILDRLSMPLESGRRAEKPASSSSSQDRRARSHSRERSSSRRDPSPSGGDRRRRDHSAERKPASKSNSSGTADPPKKDAPQPVLVDGPRPRPTDNPNERFGGKSLRTPSRTLWIGSVPYKARKQWMEETLDRDRFRVESYKIGNGYAFVNFRTISDSERAFAYLRDNTDYAINFQ